MSELSEKCDDIYKSVMITAQRAKQIIDKSAIQIDENEDVDDENPNPHEINYISAEYDKDELEF